MPNSVVQWWCSTFVVRLPPTIGQQIAVTINRTMQMRLGTLTMPIKSQCRWWWWRWPRWCKGSWLWIPGLNAGSLSASSAVHLSCTRYWSPRSRRRRSRSRSRERVAQWVWPTEATAGDQFCTGDHTTFAMCLVIYLFRIYHWLIGRRQSEMPVASSQKSVQSSNQS